MIDTPCQICESESLIIAGTRMGHICQDCMRELRVIARIHHPTAADVMTLRAERKVKAVT